MNKSNIIIFLILTFKLVINKYKSNNKINEKNELNGFYKITSILNNYNIFIKNKILILSNEYSLFNIIQIDLDEYYIESVKLKKLLSIDEKGNIKINNKNENINDSKLIWNIIKVKNNQYLIRNKFNKKYLKVDNILIKFTSNISFSLDQIYNNSNLLNCSLFNFLKLFEEIQIKQKFLKFVYKEPIDIVIKYIDLTDKKLNRIGIKQIYKDKDNEELRYSIRSIFKNIPWIRKIFIIMPNEKVRFFKSVDEIKEKILYIKDRDFLGYDSANNCAFTLNLHKMENFGISKNFIYMDDDYFIGSSLSKIDFFYFDEIDKKVSPYILTLKFKEINKTNVLQKYDEMFKKKDLIHPHSGKGFFLSILCTEKFFIDNYNFSLIKTEYTHNAISLNIDLMKEIFCLIKKYKYFNETIYSKERYILRLSQQHLVNLYQLNIKHKKIHSIPHKYISIELLKKVKIIEPLYVINTGGNHIPLERQYKLQKKIMKERFPFANKYEIRTENKNLIFSSYLKFINYTFHIFKILILLKLIKKINF